MRALPTLLVLSVAMIAVFVRPLLSFVCVTFLLGWSVAAFHPGWADVSMTDGLLTGFCVALVARLGCDALIGFADNL